MLKSAKLQIVCLQEHLETMSPGLPNVAEMCIEITEVEVMETPENCCQELATENTCTTTSHP